MADFLDIAGGIMLSAVISLTGYPYFQGYLAGNNRKELNNHQLIKGIVLEEKFIPNLFGDKYQVSIKTPEGKKFLVSYGLACGADEPSALDTLFSQGDNVLLEVATNKNFDGRQRFVGLSGMLFDDKLK